MKTNEECLGCGGDNCPACGAHRHPWEGGMFHCDAEALRFNAERLAGFMDALKGATAVQSSSGMLHAVDCHIVRAHIAGAERPWWWSPWRVIHRSTITGRASQCCSPAATVQAKPRRMIRRLTGLGWPDEDGRCAKGRLPRWAKATS